MSSTRICVAEDDSAHRELLVHHLQRDGFTTVEATDGAAAIRLVRNGIDLLLLDVGLPAIDGFDVVRTLRRDGVTTPIIMITARSDEVDRVIGFELGTDDYVIHRPDPREVVARVRAILRRSGIKHDQMPSVLRFGRLEIDEAAREVRIDGCDAALKPREFALLLALASRPGIAFSREMLLARVWGFDYDGDERTVDVHIRRLRSRIEERPEMGPFLRTVHGFGYKFAPP